MNTHSSASVRVETPHETETTQITISDALRRRAQAVINDISIDPQWRFIIRYALEINDSWLPDLVQRADAGEATIDIDSMNFSSRTPPRIEAELSEEKIEALSEIICQDGNEAAAALFVLMGTLETSTHPKVLANVGKHVAFTHCAESNLYGIVDGQIEVVESELLAGTLAS
jgi:hypothetical protein